MWGAMLGVECSKMNGTPFLPSESSRATPLMPAVAKAASVLTLSTPWPGFPSPFSDLSPSSTREIAGEGGADTKPFTGQWQ